MGKLDRKTMGECFTGRAGRRHLTGGEAAGRIRPLRAYSSALLALFLLSFAFVYGCTPRETVKQDAPAETARAGLPELTALEASDHRLVVSANAPFEYTVYKPSDPFKVVVELKGVTPGRHEGKIETGGTGITEARARHIKTPAEGTRIELLLDTPGDVVPEYRDGTLTLRIEEPLVAAEEAEPAFEGQAEEAAVLPADVEESPALPPAQYIEGLSMERLRDRVVVRITGDGSMIPEVFPVEDRVVIDIPGVAMRASVPEEVIKPVKGLRWGEHDGGTRIVLDLEPNTAFDVVSVGESIEVSVRSPELLSEVVTAGAAEAPPPSEAPEAEAAGGEGRYTGRKISLDFQDADIIPIFRLLADVSGKNIIVDPRVKGKITMKLINVPWDQALDLILKTHNLDKAVEGNVIRIAPVDVLTKEREEAAKKKAAERKAEPLVTKVFPISYAEVGNVKSSLEQAKILSERGSISVDERISSLIVQDIPSNMPRVEELIKTLDRPTPQVMIEARIVEVNTNASKEFGIRWGLATSTFDKRFSLGGLTPYTVDFPSGAGPGSGSGITFGFINATGTLSLDLEISALQTTGKLKIVSNPRVVTVDNEEAMISQGKSIPVRKLTSEGTVSTEFKDVKLELKVRPHITPDRSIILNVEAKKEELDPTIPSVEGVPGTDKKEAKTKVIIKDGETLVIGGIYKTVDNLSESGVPGMKNIPILGWLFKNEKVEDTTNELLIFITPRIIEKPTLE